MIPLALWWTMQRLPEVFTDKFLFPLPTLAFFVDFNETVETEFGDGIRIAISRIDDFYGPVGIFSGDLYRNAIQHPNKRGVDPPTLFQVENEASPASLKPA